MKRLLFLAPLLLVLACTENTKETQQQYTKKINVGYNRTIETVMILRSLSDSDYFLHRIPDSNKSRPMLYRARKYFAGFKDHPAVKETQNLLYSASDIGGLLFQGVLYAEELPGTRVISEPGSAYWKAHRSELEQYMKLLGQFYTEANVEQFLEENKEFYKGAVAEAKHYIHDTIAGVMESYFGKDNGAYYMYIMPMCPYGWGFSAIAVKNGAKEQYAIISPVKGIKGREAGVSEFGFGGDEARAHYRELVVHEFVHTFITDVLEYDSFRKQIAQYDTLYTSVLDSVMQEQGYSGWWSFVNEHLVRLGHLRVARQVSDDEATQLSHVDVYDYRFVLQPEWESRMMEYEENREQYKTIDDYLPKLIDYFALTDTATLNLMLVAD